MASVEKSSPKLTGDRPAAAARKVLPNRKDLAFIAIERTRMPMVVTDTTAPDNPIVLANRAFLALSGYGADEVLGRNCRFLQGPDTDALAVAAVREGIAREEDVNVELLNYRSNGQPIWVQLHLSPIHDDDGRLVYYFGSQLDVTQRKKVEALEASERRLLKEVDHRAMNVMAIVEGIVRLTRAESSLLYAAAVQRRVQALARAHVILAERGWKDVPLTKLISVQIEPFSPPRVDLQGPEVLLGGHLVQPLALVLHELIANSAAHGSLTVPTGSLIIRWATDETGQRLDLHWHESGGPQPKPERPNGFGATIIKGIVDRQLNGELRRTWDPDGLKAHLSFPLAA